VRADDAVSLRARFRRGTYVVHTDFQHYVGGLGGADHEPGIIAYFDLDRTLIAGYSVMALAWERILSGSVPLRRVLSSVGALVEYGLGRADYHHLLTITVRDLAGESEQTLAALGVRAFEQRVQGWIYAEARALIDAHRREGHHIVIVTSATRFQAEPIARGLGVEDLCCTELEILEGQVTGKALPCFGDGKLAAAEHLAHQRQTDLSRAYFYSDSSDDLPLLEAVGRPVVVNPKMAMARLARARGWPCLVFAPPGYMRSAAA
jgi:putative phosphoserine phosphatase / 1-acylglycerol-3-phosphate O-acyltransferase